MKQEEPRSHTGGRERKRRHRRERGEGSDREDRGGQRKRDKLVMMEVDQSQDCLKEGGTATFEEDSNAVSGALIGNNGALIGSNQENDDTADSGALIRTSGTESGALVGTNIRDEGTADQSGVSMPITPSNDESFEMVGGGDIDHAHITQKGVCPDTTSTTQNDPNKDAKDNNGRPEIDRLYIQKLLASFERRRKAKKKKRRKRRRKGSGRGQEGGAELEGCRVRGLERCDTYEPGSEDEEDTTMDKQNNLILRKLFKKSGKTTTCIYTCITHTVHVVH